MTEVLRGPSSPNACRTRFPPYGEQWSRLQTGSAHPPLGEYLDESRGVIRESIPTAGRQRDGQRLSSRSHADHDNRDKRLLRAVFLSLLEASKLKDNDTGKHITRVNFYSRRLAEELFTSGDPGYKRIDADFIDNIGFLASMHDVGKIGTPDDILNKEGPLSDWEWTVMREHTKNGAFILSTYPNPMAKEIALSHHEKWNGTGYPFQLEGDMIPLAARIVTVADVYDALRMERSYKPALSHAVTVEKIMEGKGSHFDPSLTDMFARIAGDFEHIFDSNKD
jgi:putative two-component system response regulator